MKKLLLFAIICFSLGANVFAQLDTSDFSYQLEFVDANEENAGMDTIYFHNIHLTLNDTVNVSEIAIKVGTTEGLGDIVDYEFVFDKNTLLPEGFTYFRRGSQLKLTVGKRSAATYYYEVRLKGNNYTVTQAKKWSGWSH